MANTINYAAKYARDLIETYIDGSYAAPFVALNVDWLDAKNFHFTVMTTGGYKNHSLNGGWNRQPITETDKVYTVSQDRDVELFLDKREVDESNKTATIEKVSKQFESTQAVPEKDAYFFSKVVSEAETAGLKTSTALSAYTKANVLTKIKTLIGNVRRYRNKGLIVYIRPEIMDLLSLSEELTHSIDVATIAADDGKAIQTRITVIDGTPVVEVIDDDRFYSAINMTDGWAPATGAYKINILAATPLTTKMVPKIESIYFFEPGQHTEGDGYLYQNRAHYDTFVFPNGKNGKIDSIYVDLDTTAVPAPSED